ncbi:MAG: branched-chain amino acid aminotransferase [Bacteroidota bacterium]
MIETIEIQKNLTQQSKINQIDFDNIKFGRVYSDHMFIAEYKDGEWKDFNIHPYSNLSMSPAATVIHYGQSIFEGLKAYKTVADESVVFRPLENWKRLNASAERMCIPQISEEIFMSGLTELLRLDEAWIPNKPNTSLYIRPFIFATDEYVGIRPSDNYRFIIFTCPVGAYYSEPVKVKIETKYTRAIEGGTGYAKAAGNYASSLYPAKLAQEKGYHQLIWTDGKEHKYIEESGTMNLVFVIDGKIVTAPTGDTILRGITRDSVLTLAKDWGYEVEERRISVEEIIRAIESGKLQEAFGVGTAATIAKIAVIGHEEMDYKLPEASEEDFSWKVLKALDDIKTGRAEDDHNWLYKI